MPAPATSVQLYSLHAELDADLDGALGRLAQIGFDTVEAFDFPRRVQELKAAFARYGLSSPTAHARLIDGEDDSPDKLLTDAGAQATFQAATELGIKTVIEPWVEPARWQDRDEVMRTAAALNALAEPAAQHGLRVGYHNHDHELRSHIDGRPALELFAAELSPEVVLELDLYWAYAAGADLPELLANLGARVTAVHIKDGPMRPGITAGELPEDQCPAGEGDVPLLAAIGAARSSRLNVIEFDHFSGDIFEGIAASYRYLADNAGARS